ncbi:unnamed protein product, partial [Closterium sp. NIES-64]
MQQHTSTLPDKALRGIIHADIFKLTALSYLYVSTLNLSPNQPGARLGANHLTRTLPAMASQLQVLAIASNLLAGAFPTQPFQLCDIRSNCLSSPGSCTNDAGVAQRTSGSAFCALALLALRAGLGVSALSWAVDSPCTLAGNAPAVDSWTGVVCDLSGQVLSLDLSKMKLRGSLHADISKLTALTSLNMASNLLDARMSEWAQSLTSKALKQLSILLP